jgi:transcriptional regulator with XRE-family HTH domain
VIGPGRKQPDGAKIVNLRKQKGLKQEDLAKRGNISVRTLRDIERSNHPVPATTITAIATALQTTPDEITLSTDGTPDLSVSLLKLTAIRSAKDLSALASGASEYDWKLEAVPSSETAKDMQHLMTIVRRLVFSSWRHEKDEFDAEEFGEIPRLARLQELLERLRERGVGVIAGKYATYSLIKTVDYDLVSDIKHIPDYPKWLIKTTFCLCIRLVPAEKQEDDIQFYPGKSLDRLLEEVKSLPDDSSELPDDDLPF